MVHPVISEDLEFIASASIDWKQLGGKTVLITGAAGFLPAYMVETLLYLNDTRHLGCRVVGFVRNLPKAQQRFAAYMQRDDFELMVGDIAEPQSWQVPCEVLIHAASQASPKFYGSDPVGTMNANILGTYHLLNQAKKWGSEMFLFFSSGEVYGEVSPQHIPTRESDYGYTDINLPRSCYAESKRAAETMGICHASQHGTPFKIVRPFHTYGPGMSLDDGRVFADFVRDLAEKKDLQLRSDGKAVRAFCYLSDAVRGFFSVLLHGEQATAYNVGNPQAALSIGELADLLVALRPEDRLKVVRSYHAPDGYVPSTISVNIPNVDRLNALGWAPKHAPHEGFSRTLRFYTE